MGRETCGVAVSDDDELPSNQDVRGSLAIVGLDMGFPLHMVYVECYAWWRTEGRQGLRTLAVWLCEIPLGKIYIWGLPGFWVVLGSFMRKVSVVLKDNRGLNLDESPVCPPNAVLWCG